MFNQCTTIWLRRSKIHLVLPCSKPWRLLPDPAVRTACTVLCYLLFWWTWKPAAAAAVWFGFYVKEGKQASQVCFLYNAELNQSQLCPAHIRHCLFGRKPVPQTEELLQSLWFIHVANHKYEGLLLGPVPNKPEWTLNRGSQGGWPKWCIIQCSNKNAFFDV